MAGVGGATLSDWATGRTCDYCQEVCDGGDLLVLSCLFDGCPNEGDTDDNSVYHEDCIDEYAKSLGLNPK